MSGHDRRLPGKPALRILNAAPLCAETPAHLLDDPVTPTERLFVRNNGRPPAMADAAGWTLEIDGEVQRPLRLSLADLRDGFETVALALQPECAGNGRAFFDPAPEGEPWICGAISCPAWTGVRLRDVLERAGLTPSAVYTAHYGADAEDAVGNPISRGVPIAKALEPHTLLAWAVNGEPLPPEHGFPLRLVVPGSAGSCSHKWLTRIRVRECEHDGPRMTSPHSLPVRPLDPTLPWRADDLAPMPGRLRQQLSATRRAPCTGRDLRPWAA